MTHRTMMRQFVVPMALAALVACGGAKEDAPKKDDGVMPAAEMVGRIRAMEDTLFADSLFNRRGAQTLLDVYKAFAKAHPLDTMAPEYLFRAAGMAKGLGQPQESIQYYDRIIKDYGHWRRLADTYYLRAFTIDSDLGEKGRAKTAYEEVIAKFPDHRFAKDARAMIDNLQYTDEELIERFKKMNAEAEAKK
jgi:TolA-binding protein